MSFLTTNLNVVDFFKWFNNGHSSTFTKKWNLKKGSKIKTIFAIDCSDNIRRRVYGCTTSFKHYLYILIKNKRFVLENIDGVPLTEKEIEQNLKSNKEIKLTYQK